MNHKWKEVRLDAIASIGAGNSAPQSKNAFCEDGELFIRTSDVGKIKSGEIFSSTDKLTQSAAKGFKRFRAGTVLMPKSGASTFNNHRVIMQREGCVSSHLAAITGFEDKVDDRFLWYFLHTVNAQDLIQDQAYPSLNLRQISGIAVPLPPLDEQKRIVSKLDETLGGLDQITQNSKTALDQVEALWSSILINEFESELWREQDFSDVIDVYQPSTISIKQLVPDGPFLVYGANGVIGRYTEFNHEDSELLMTCRGATCGALNISSPKSWINGNAMVVRPKSVELDKSFVFYALLGGIDINAAITGTAQPQITRSSLAKLKFKFPEIGEQKRIVAKLDQLKVRIDELRKTKLDSIEEANALRSSVLTAAFSGDF